VLTRRLFHKSEEFINIAQEIFDYSDVPHQHRTTSEILL
jgi:hypothetical protein